jgi:N6-adenosine-specific RNA methylase IME4
VKYLTPAGGDPAGGMLFDISPIKIAGFTLRARGIQPVGRPTLEQWTAALQFANAAQESSPYWVGDLLNYADTRADWKEAIDQAMSIAGIARHTAINLAYVARHVEEPEREIAPTLSHAAEVAPLPKDQQRKYLKTAQREGWTRRELRLQIKAEKRPLVLEGQAVLEGRYRIIYADPPWLYDRSSGFSATKPHYRGLPLEDICKLPVEAHAQPDAVLFLWVTSPMLPLAFPVIEAWGFTYKTSIVWDKVLSAGGHYVAVKHELLLIATRGSCTPDAPVPSPDSVVVIRRPGEHSEKPEEFRRLITQLYTRGPYLELFARRPVEGWTTFGNDARLWAREGVPA